MFNHSRAYWTLWAVETLAWIVLCHFANLSNMLAFLFLIIILLGQHLGVIEERERQAKKPTEPIREPRLR